MPFSWEWEGLTHSENNYNKSQEMKLIAQANMNDICWEHQHFMFMTLKGQTQ